MSPGKDLGGGHTLTTLFFPGQLGLSPSKSVPGPYLGIQPDWPEKRKVAILYVNPTLPIPEMIPPTLGEYLARMGSKVIPQQGIFHHVNGDKGLIPKSLAWCLWGVCMAAGEPHLELGGPEISSPLIQ